MQNAYTQAFEDFLNADAERAIVEATRHRGEGSGLWVLLFDDGRYTLEHGGDEAQPQSRGDGLFIAFPVEGLGREEFDPQHPEDSRFDRAIDKLWRDFRQAHAAALHHQA